MPNYEFNQFESLFHWPEWRKHIIEFIKQYAILWIAIIVIQAIIYSYLFTTVLFTNHTLPNVWTAPYPSFKTHGEGRWFADIIILIQGSSGVQSLQMVLAVTLQAFNGIVFALLIGVRSRVRLALVSGILCFYPAFLDYYSFSIVHLTFVLGDTLAILGAVALLRLKQDLPRIVIGSIFLVLSMATYGSKIALVGYLSSLVVLLSATQSGNKMITNASLTSFIKIFFLISITFCISVITFWISTRLSINFDIGIRAYINSPSQMYVEALKAYSWIGNYILNPGGFPQFLKWVPAMLIVIGIVVLSLDVFSKHGGLVLCCCLAIFLIQPILLRLSYVINQNSWEDTGRIVSANGYALAFFIAFGLNHTWSRRLVIPLASISLYFYIILASQENNAAAIKNIYELNFINRITSRIESTIDTTKISSMGLVVVGNYPKFNQNKYVKYPDLHNKSNFLDFTFANYRQTEILNFFMGKELFRRPTMEEVQKVILTLEKKPSWPASKSVFLMDDIAVVLLEPYKSGIKITN